MQSDLASTPLPGWAKSVEDQFPFSEAMSKKKVTGPSDRLLAGTNKTASPSSTSRHGNYVHPYAQQERTRESSFDVSYRKSESGIPEYNAYEDPHCSYARTNEVARRAQRRVRRMQEEQFYQQEQSFRQRHDHSLQHQHQQLSHQQHQQEQQRQGRAQDKLLQQQQQQQQQQRHQQHGKENNQRRFTNSNVEKQRRPKSSSATMAGKPSVSYQHGFVDPERELSVIKLILLREGQVRSANALARRCQEENNAHGQLVSMTSQLIELIECIRESTVGVVEAISAWKRSAEAEPLKASVQSPVFMWSSGWVREGKRARERER